MLYPTPRPAASDLTVMAGIDESRDRLRRRMSNVPGAWLSGFRAFLTADAVASSNRIEGFRVGTEDARDLADGERDVDVSDENREETLAYHRTMSYVQSLHDVTDFAYSKSLLNALHWMLQGHRRNKPAGQWRSGPVHVVGSRHPRVAIYTAPAAADVPGLMAELVGWLNTDDGSHPLIRAAMAHLHLVSIHPWADGNGRMSRSLQTLMIAREGVLAPELCSIEAWLGEPLNTWEYYQELQRRGATYRPDQDVSGWIRLNLDAYRQRVAMVRCLLDRSVTVRETLLAFAGDTGLDERVVPALHDVAVHGRARRGRHLRTAGITVRQAERDLRDLVSAGLLAPAGSARFRRYTEGDRFPEKVLELARTPFTRADLYPSA